MAANSSSSWTKLNLPPGFRFCPYTGELAEHYLMRKVLGRPLPCDAIRDMDIYLHDPDDLPVDMDDGQEIWDYFFMVTTEEKQERHTPGGYWLREKGDKAVKNKEGKVIAFKSSFVFCRGSAPEGRRTAWRMNEFRLNKELREFKNLPPEMGNCVVCKIKKAKAGATTRKMPSSLVKIQGGS